MLDLNPDRVGLVHEATREMRDELFHRPGSLQRSVEAARRVARYGPGHDQRPFAFSSRFTVLLG